MFHILIPAILGPLLAVVPAVRSDGCRQEKFPDYRPVARWPQLPCIGWDDDDTGGGETSESKKRFLKLVATVRDAGLAAA